MYQGALWLVYPKPTLNAAEFSDQFIIILHCILGCFDMPILILHCTSCSRALSEPHIHIQEFNFFCKNKTDLFFECLPKNNRHSSCKKGLILLIKTLLKIRDWDVLRFDRIYLNLNYSRRYTYSTFLIGTFKMRLLLPRVFGDPLTKISSGQPKKGRLRWTVPLRHFCMKVAL
jgi:hypothetical protein